MLKRILRITLIVRNFAGYDDGKHGGGSSGFNDEYLNPAWEAHHHEAQSFRDEYFRPVWEAYHREAQRMSATTQLSRYCTTFRLKGKVCNKVILYFCHFYHSFFLLIYDYLSLYFLHVFSYFQMFLYFLPS